jgi:hypothetical protein
MINSASVEAIICSTETPGARSSNLNPFGVTSKTANLVLFLGSLLFLFFKPLKESVSKCIPDRDYFFFNKNSISFDTCHFI